MTRNEALDLARPIVAAVCELNGDAPDYVQFLRDGAYDDDRTVRAGHEAFIAGIRHAERAARDAKPALSVAA